MEKQNIKGTYLQYFPQRTLPISRKGPHFALKKAEPPKLLPHIQEEYQYRITNHLLINKIISPKRDKIIMSSLQSIKRGKHNSKGKIQSRSQNRHIFTRSTEKRNNRSEYRLRTAENSLHTHEPSYSSIDPFPASKDSLFKHNMTIIHNNIHKDDNEPSDPKHTQSTKMTKLIMRSLHEQRTVVHRPNPHPLQTNGCGPTILAISHLEIIANPPLRGETLLQLQLIQRPCLHQGHNQEEKVVRSSPIAYYDLPKDDVPRSKIKFALKISKIGDFVPLRLWKYSGVDCSELGTVDIPLSLYKLVISGSASVGQSDNIRWQEKSGTGLGRNSVSGEVACQLRRGNSMQLQTKVVLKYVIYSKRFTKIRNGP